MALRLNLGSSGFVLLLALRKRRVVENGGTG
jgi:hypothetical protein